MTNKISIGENLPNKIVKNKKLSQLQLSKSYEFGNRGTELLQIYIEIDR